MLTLIVFPILMIGTLLYIAAGLLSYDEYATYLSSKEIKNDSISISKG